MSEIIFGIHTVQAMSNRNPQRIQQVWILKGRNDHRLKSLITILQMHGIIIQIATRQWMNSKVKGAVHQGIIAQVKSVKCYYESDLLNLLSSVKELLLLVLDGVTDPHNLGACLRSADAAGVHGVIVQKNRSVQLNATVKKVACGAADNVPIIRVTNLVNTLRLLHEYNIWIIGTDHKATHDLWESKMTNPLALVMGAEGKGIRRLTREYCDDMIRLPMAGSVSSLNVSVTTGICLFEAVRQRRRYFINI